MAQITKFLESIDSLVWGPPLIALLIGTGIFLTFRLRLLQVFHLPKALYYIFAQEPGAEDGDVSSFQALCTALAATIGTGNIVGVALAVAAGGPGAVFWMWIAAFFGMATKYAECLLAVKFRTVDENGQMAGGPMYYIELGLHNKWLAKLFAIFGVGVAFLGIGTFPQIKAITSAMQNTFQVPVLVSALLIGIIVAAVTLGGIKSIGRVTEWVVPFMAALYIIGAIIIMVMNADKLPAAVALIFSSAFTGSAAVGGFLGASVMYAMRNGFARGIFSNESGLGSAPIAAAAAKTNSCVRQGLISMTGTFFDTIIICTMTGIILVMTGAWSADVEGTALTTLAFESGLPGIGPYIVTIGLVFFALTTILGWNYYGERCLVYLVGTKGILPYRLVFILLVFSGAFMKLDIIWIIADIVNGLMAVPNLIALIGLQSVVVDETRRYFELYKTRKGKTPGISECSDLA